MAAPNARAASPATLAATTFRSAVEPNPQIASSHAPMSALARLPSYPSPTTLIARSGIQFLDFGFDPARLRVREWGFHDAASTKSVDDLVQLDFDEGRGQS